MQSSANMFIFLAFSAICAISDKKFLIFTILHKCVPLVLFLQFMSFVHSCNFERLCENISNLCNWLNFCHPLPVSLLPACLFIYFPHACFLCLSWKQKFRTLFIKKHASVLKFVHGKSFTRQTNFDAVFLRQFINPYCSTSAATFIPTALTRIDNLPISKAKIGTLAWVVNFGTLS
jgi:hypothetical protein